MDMTFAAAQDVIVGLIAAGAAALVVRRVVGFAATDATPKCASCESGACAPAAASAPAGPQSPAPGSTSRPLVFVRSSER